MTTPENTVRTGPVEIDAAQAQDAAGGTTCSADELVALTASLKQAYDNLVDFTSHVIERVASS
jgi:hypothetical protein